MAYTKEDVAVIAKAAEVHGEINYEIAKELARELCKTPRSVASKAISMELPYAKQEKAPKREKGATKTELVAQIAENLGAAADQFDGLTKATAKALGRLVELT